MAAGADHRREDGYGQVLLEQLNRHGYGFQQRVLKECEGLESPGPFGVMGRWHLRAVELPVDLNGRDIHVDGVLEFTSSGAGFNLLAVIECKRVDPALGRWGFARREGRQSNLGLDRYQFSTDPGHLQARAHEIHSGGQPVVHVGMDLPTNHVKGNSTGKTLEDTVNQALRGAGGLAQRLPELSRFLGRPTFIVPVVVTTASIAWMPTPLETADLSTGTLSSAPVLEVPWLWYSVNVTKSLSPGVLRAPSGGASDPIRHMLLHQHRRAVVISTATGMGKALGAVSQIDPTPLD